MPRLTSCLFLLGPALFVAATLTSSSSSADHAKEIVPLLTKYCASCHGQGSAPGGISLAGLETAASLKTKRDVWERIETNLVDGHMPPAGAATPSKAQRDKLVSYIKGALGPAVANPGRVTIRRLNREEYNNTVRDLFGVDMKPAEDFPSDDVGYGFDNIGDVLSMSPLLMEKYMKAAQQIATTVIYTPGDRHFRFSGADIDAPSSNPMSDGSRVLFTNASIDQPLVFPAEGDYKLTVRAYQTKAGPENAKMGLRFNGQDIKVVDVAGTSPHPQDFEVQFHAPFGLASVGASFLNDYYEPRTLKSPGADRNLGVVSLQVDGPIGGPAKLPPSQSRIIFVQPTPQTRVDCERKILATLANRAYRRPASKAEVDKLVSIAELAHKNGETFEGSIQLGVVAVLCSPNFLFRAEKPQGENLSGYELASRLSYFLWSSMPDDELLQLAAKGELQKPEVLAAQAARMLKDPKSAALAQNFAGQWLQIRKLGIVNPDRKLFPEFSDELRRDMAMETGLFFLNVVKNDRSVLDFIDANYSYLNEPLAKLYGIEGVRGNEFRLVQLPGDRGGIFTQASVLTVTSNPTRTSPVKRGKWILENILGTPPAPPPPGVGVLREDQLALDSASLRERMEQHRKDPKCATCHETMDGLGFALENFDGVGAWRTKDGKFDIDASGTLPDGTEFKGPEQLRTVLMKRKNQFVRCLSEKLLTYAIGRGLESYDDVAVQKIMRIVSDGGYKFSALVTSIVESDPFRKCRAER